MTDSNTGLRVGAACNQAAEVLGGAWRLLAEGKVTTEQLIQMHLDLAEGFIKNANTIQAAASVGEAFPGTTQVPQQAFQPQQQAPQPQQAPGPFDGGGFTPANVVQAPFGQQQAPQGQNFQPAPGAGGGSKVDQEWQALFNNPSGYYDNRQDKKSPNGPDFKNKQTGDGLWLNGKYGPAPQWVLDRLQGGYGPVQ